MVSTLDKKLFKELWKIKGQVFAVSSVIACGISVYISFFSAFLNLNLSKNTYYNEYRFHDFSISLEKAPLNSIFKIQNIDGIKSASGRIIKEVPLTINDQKDLKTAKIVSLPKQLNSFIDNIYIASGRKPYTNEINECLVDTKFLEANKLKLNDLITVTTNGKKQKLKIVGTAMSPEFVYVMRNISELIPNPAKFAIIWVNKDWAESAFNLKGFYNDLVVEINEPNKIDEIISNSEKILDSYGVYTKIKRKDQLSNWILTSKIDQLEVSSKVTPSIFLSVAAVILLIVIARMVKKERTYIGLLKAYGYTNWEISLNYIKFAIIIGLIGGLIGIVLGQWLSYGIMSVYSQFYSFPELKYKFHPSLSFIGLLISISTCLISSLFAISSVIKINPAEAMKENTSLVVVSTPFEKISFFWNRISFINKVIIRNIWRYPLRALFTAFGVMLSTAILFLGRFSSDSIQFMMDFQFNKVQREDLKISFYIERDKRASYEASRFPYIKKAEEMLVYPFETKNSWHKKQLAIYGLKENAELFNLIDILGNKIKIAKNNVFISDSLAKELDLKVGSKLILKPLMGKVKKEQEIIISGVVQQYLGSGIYMNINDLSRLLGTSKTVNTILFKIEDSKNLPELNNFLKDIPLISSVELKKDSLDNFNKNTADSMIKVNFLLTMFAGVIAIAVIYNSTVINLTEREKEIASLQVLGFNEDEVGKIIFTENIWLSMIGMLLGLPLGYYLCLAMTKAYDTDFLRIPFYISSSTYIVCMSIITFFVLATNAFLKRRIYQINIIDVLKTRE
ncbi:MAG: FtsX-like permease family protein [Candidatus Sericytochromatia bacterium]